MLCLFLPFGPLGERVGVGGDVDLERRGFREQELTGSYRAVWVIELQADRSMGRRSQRRLLPVHRHGLRFELQNYAWLGVRVVNRNGPSVQLI